jgi:hypothetical protein
MGPMRILHLILLLFAISVGILLVKWLLIVETPRRLAPVPEITQIQPAPPQRKNEARKVVTLINNQPQPLFPPTLNRNYAAMPVMWEKKLVEVAIDEGDIQTARAPNWPPRDKQIAPAASVVKLPWIFALP